MRDTTTITSFWAAMFGTRQEEIEKAKKALAEKYKSLPVKRGYGKYKISGEGKSSTDKQVGHLQITKNFFRDDKGKVVEVFMDVYYSIPKTEADAASK